MNRTRVVYSRFAMLSDNDLAETLKCPYLQEAHARRLARTTPAAEPVSKGKRIKTLSEDLLGPVTHEGDLNTLLEEWHSKLAPYQTGCMHAPEIRWHLTIEPPVHYPRETPFPVPHLMSGTDRNGPWCIQHYRKATELYEPLRYWAKTRDELLLDQKKMSVLEWSGVRYTIAPVGYTQWCHHVKGVLGRLQTELSYADLRADHHEEIVKRMDDLLLYFAEFRARTTDHSQT